MTVDAAVVPGLLLLALELLALACVGYLVARVALRQGDEGMALAQGLVIGPALWGLIVSFVLHLLPGMAGALAGWIIVVALGAGLAWRAPQALRVPLRSIAGFGLAGTPRFFGLRWLAANSSRFQTLKSTWGWPPLSGPGSGRRSFRGTRGCRSITTSASICW